MEITRSIRFGLLIMTLLAMVGCGSTEQTKQTTDTSVEQPKRIEDPETVKFAVRGGKLTVDGESLDGLFYFDFDQSIIKREGHAELNTHAQALSQNSSWRVRLEGHADERGTREYNNALGERRANAVRGYLMSQGVSSAQIEVVSYGEERPAVQGSNERSWALNRRVQIVYR